MFGFFTKKPEALTLGRIGERFAQRYYEQLGYKIVAKNEFNKKGKQLGEIDFIAASKDTIIFVEVKTRVRAEGKFGSAEEAVNMLKQTKILKAVKTFLFLHREYAGHRPQIDVCAVDASNLQGLSLVSLNPAKYELKCTLDKLSFSVKILMNAVEDWN